MIFIQRIHLFAVIIFLLLFLPAFFSLYHYKTIKVTAFFEGIADINKKPRCQYHSGAFTILIKYGLIYPG
jgi:hypothetical protein